MKGLFKKVAMIIKQDQQIPAEFQNIESLKDEPNSYFERGKKVRVINNLQYIEYIQKGNGGWNPAMSKCVDEICTVEKVDSDWLISIRTPSGAVWLLNRSVLVPYSPEEENDSTTLLSAIEKDDLDGFLAIVKNEKQKINLNIKNKEGRTLINLACCLGHSDIVKYLCESGADIGIPDQFGNMPIHNCAINGHIVTLKIIVNKYPESIHQKQENGKTLIDIAQETMNKNLENYINEKLEDENVVNKKKEKFDPKEISFPVDMAIASFSSKKKSKDLLDKDMPSLCDPPEMSLLEKKSFHYKEKSINKIPIYESVLGTLKLKNPPTDNNVSYPALSLKMICKNCKVNSVNYRTSCGHCFCSRCIAILKICPSCTGIIGENPLKIFI